MSAAPYIPPVGAMTTNNPFKKANKEADLLDLGTKKSNSTSLFNPDDILISMKNQTKGFYDDYEEESEESSNLLGNEAKTKPLAATSTNVYQAKANMQKKKDYKTDNISSSDAEKNRTLF
jgi:hypothetical protein